MERFLNMKFLIMTGPLLLLGCSGDTPASLGRQAATAETAFSVFGRNREAHAATFMKAWVQACSLAKNDMTSAVHTQFMDSYLEGLKREPDAAMKKPLQQYVRSTWWRSGVGCETILRETPEWALK